MYMTSGQTWLVKILIIYRDMGIPANLKLAFCHAITFTGLSQLSFVIGCFIWFKWTSCAPLSFKVIYSPCNYCTTCILIFLLCCEFWCLVVLLINTVGAQVMYIDLPQTPASDQLSLIQCTAGGHFWGAFAVTDTSLSSWGCPRKLWFYFYIQCNVHSPQQCPKLENLNTMGIK